MEKSDYINICYELADMDISAFPMGGGYYDKKLGAFTYKKPPNILWKEYQQRVPASEEIELWENIPEINGIAIVTGYVSNIACVDVDTTDPEMQRRILELLPATPCIILGNPSRPGKFIYKLHDGITEPPMERKRNFKGAVDIIMGGGYICIPPGHHSMLNGIYHDYTWKYKSIIDCWDDIPVLNPLVIDQIEMAINGYTKQEIIQNMPSDRDVTSGDAPAQMYRNENMKGYVSSLIRQRLPAEQAIQMLTDYDQTNFGTDLLFMDKSKGHYHRDASLNARVYYTKMLDTINKGKLASEPLELPNTVSVSAIMDGDTEWPEPKAVNTMIHYPAFDIDIVPERIRKHVKDISELNAVSPQNVFLYMLGAYSATVGNKILIRPYRNNKKYTQACNLYVGIVAASGERKTQTTQQAKAPLLRLHKQKQEEYKQKEIDSKDHNNAIDVSIIHQRKSWNKMIENEGADSEEAKEILKKIEEEEGRKIELKKVSLYEQENTTEKNYQITVENPNGFFIEYSEWGCAYNKFQNKDNAALRRYVLDGWDGDAMLSYKTKHQGEQYLERYCLSVGFSCQLSVIQEQIWQLQQTTDDGLLPRFMFAVSDDIKRPVVDYDSIIDDTLYDMYCNSFEIEESGISIPFTEEASIAWQSYQSDINNEIETTKESTLKSFRSKHIGLVVRIAALVALINNNGKIINNVTLENFNNAKLIIDYVWGSTQALFRSSIKALLEKIILEIRMTTIPIEIPVADLVRFHSHLFTKDAEKTMELLKMLYDLDIARFDKSSQRATIVRFNPKLLA